MNWKKMFAPHILERGQMYWNEGAVTELNYDDTGIGATVEGSDEYEVSVGLDRGNVIDMSCTCPHAADGNNCKHMAAVLYAWGSAKNNAPTTDSDWQQLVDKADEQTLRTYLMEALRNDSKLRRRFIAEVAPEQTHDYLDEVIASVDEIVDQYMEEGYIDYYAADGFTEEMNSLLADEADTRLESRQYADAFEVAAAVFLALDDIEIDDSDGGITLLAEHCQSICLEVLEHADDTLKRRIFNWLTEHTGGEIIDYLEDYCEDTLARGFDAPEYLQKLLAAVQKQLDSAMKQKNTSSSWEFNAERCAMRCLHFMEKLSYSDGQIRAFCEQYRQFPDVYRTYVRRCRDAGRWEEAAEWLKAAIESNPQSGSIDHIVLKEAYRHLGWDREYRDKLWDIVTRVLPCDIEHYREYKGLFSQEEWLVEREKLYDALKDRKAMIADLYAEEDLRDRLLKVVLDSDSAFMMKRYETNLVEDYPKEVLRVYASQLRYVARSTSTRVVYQDWVKQLRHMRDISGGEKVVQAIVQEWRAAYSRRKAMMEELEKL